MTAVTLRPATPADVNELIAEPLPYRIRAWAAERDGALLAVGGLTFPPDGPVAAFLILNADAKTFAVSLHKAGKHMMNEARRLGIRRVVATAQAGNPAAVPWLKRFGYETVQVAGETIYVWSAD